MDKTNDLAERLNILRAGVLGANDGIVSVAGVVVGMASATNDPMPIFIAGLSAVLAGAFSMAGGEYVSVSTQKDTEKAAIIKQKELLKTNFEEELSSVAKYYEEQGISPELSMTIAKEVMEKHPLETTIHQKYNLEVGEYTNPWHAAFSSFISFTIGSILPMLTITLFPENLRVLFTIFAVTVALFVTGFVSATLGGAPRKPAVFRNVVVGLITMFVTYGIGHLFKI
ncbi:MAG: VIT family protein [Lactobacillales bacterium]|jgi:VIT1/CCC1 family predicted Fe2+/Mn2+ transporter|nr:VIT family protein [Lactobacillales bacterium]